MRNSSDLRIPRGSEYYLTLQRTAYQHPIQHVFRRARLGRAYDRHLLPIVESFRSAELARLYTADLETEYRSLQAALPARAGNVLDIGCGLAGIDVFLDRHYGGAIDIHLLDRDGVSDVFYGFKSEGAFYNSLSLARRLLEENDVAASRVHTFEVTRDGFPLGKSFDLVLSLISWGYHYPTATYLEQVHGALAPCGVLLLDLRRGTAGKAELAAIFGREPEIVRTTNTYERVKLIK